VNREQYIAERTREGDEQRCRLDEIPFGFAAQLHRAIMELSIGIEWHFDFIDDPTKKNPLPTPKHLRLAMPIFQTRS